MSRKGKDWLWCYRQQKSGVSFPSVQGVICIHIWSEGMLGCSPNPSSCRASVVSLSDRRLGTKSTFNSALSLEDDWLGRVEAYQVSLLLFRPKFQAQSWRIFRYELFFSSVLEKRPPALFKASVCDQKRTSKIPCSEECTGQSGAHLLPQAGATRPSRMWSLGKGRGGPEPSVYTWMWAPSGGGIEGSWGQTTSVD